MKQRIVKLEKVSATKWLNLFRIQYKTVNNKINDWFFASRKENPFNDDSPDAVVIVAKVSTPEGKKLVVTKEYRVPINDYEYGFPAGMIDPGMTAEETVQKELKEETGLDLIRIIGKSNRIYSSAGMTDESAVVYFIEAEGEINLFNQEESEDINTFLYDIDDIRKLLGSENKIGAKAWGVLFYYSSVGVI